MKVLVTGGAGYVGSVLVRQLLDRGHRVHVVDNLMFGGETMLPLFINPNFSFAKVDICDRDALAAEMDGVEAVVHLAALVGYPLCKKMPNRATEVNVGGTQNVLDTMPEDAKLIYASTGSNYGEVTGVCTEDTPLNPLSLYGRVKTEAEAMCLGRSNAIALRFATAFGLSPRPRLDLMINDFCWQAIHQRYLVVYEKHFRRTFIHVVDIARAICHMLECFDDLEHTVFNVGHQSLNFTKEDIVKLIENRVDFLVYFAEFGKDEDRRDYEVDYSRIRDVGYEVSIDIESGLSELITGLKLLEIRNPYGNV
ncbi:MAG: NAD(P)-dependent oxidoreductase [Myxococcota bacterium]|nr:NAD(P)-dependent oxidoreductase [Myxococcota bacterium]MEC9391018.1 NAD(P)-dependent oxidoreductase [Myxococcota bacterium]